jgi:hypothetical protein
LFPASATAALMQYRLSSSRECWYDPVDLDSLAFAQGSPLFLFIFLLLFLLLLLLGKNRWSCLISFGVLVCFS